MIGDIRITRASPEHARGIAEIYRKVYSERYPILEYNDDEAVRKDIESGRLCWYIALDGDKVIGSMVGVPDPWNDSFEIGRGVVDEDYRANHFGLEMFDKIIDEGFLRDVVWGHVRTEYLNKMVNRYSNNNPGRDFYLVGFAPGRHEVVERENHLIRIGLTGEAKKTRIRPPSGVARSDFIASMLLPFGFEDNKGNYPQDLVIGPGRGSNEATGSGTVYCEASERDRSVVINKVTGNEMQTIKEFMETGPWEYVGVDINPSKEKEFRELREMGFRISAYLPGWWLNDGSRYDCIRMARNSESMSQDDFIENNVRSLREGFESI